MSNHLIMTYAKFQVLINGIYGWGIGYLKREYVSRWTECCERIKEAKIGKFAYANLILPPKDGFVNTSEKFVGEHFYAYMHPMEIAGECVSCPNCITENEGEKFGNYIKEDLEKVVEVIKECFPEIEITARIRVKCNKVDIDSPTYVVEG